MPHIIHPHREIEIGQKARVTGHVKIKKVNRSGTTTFQSGFDNLILDEFLQNGFWGISGFGSAQGGLGLLVGTGVQTAPSPTDTALGNAIDLVQLGAIYRTSSSGLTDILQRIGYAEDVVLGPTAQDDYVPLTLHCEFGYSEAVGDLTELGIVARRDDSGILGFSTYQSYTSQYSLLTRALIKDSLGNPVTLTKTSAEKLIVEYELRIYRPNEPQIDVTLNGQSLRFFIPMIKREDTDPNPRDLTDLSLAANLTSRGVIAENYPEDFLGAAGLSYVEQDAQIATNFMSKGLFLHKNSARNSLATGWGGSDTLTDNVFTFHKYMSPDTSDRTMQAFTRGDMGTSDDFFKGTSASPAAIGSPRVSMPWTVYAGDILILDPATGRPKDFTLPAGYRFDMVFSFERTR